MDSFSIFLIALGLAADAFSVAVAKGTFIKEKVFSPALKTAFMFGFFQFLMPLLGFFLGSNFMKIMASFSDLAASFMLFAVGGNMLRDAFYEKSDEDGKTTFLSLIIPAIATSIDAFALSITFSCFKTDILFTASVIGITAFVLSFAGVFVGKKFSSVSKKHGALIGAGVLILLAFKFLFSFIL